MTDNNDFSQEASRVIIKLKKQLLVVYSVAFIFILGFAISLNRVRKAELAQMVMSQVKENLVLRNIRPVLISLEDTTKNSFTYIRFSDYSGKNIFTIPPEFEINSSSLFVQKFLIPIYLGVDKKTEQGILEFGYSISLILILAFVFWLLLVVVGFVIFSRYEMQLKKEQDYLIKIKNAESTNSLAKQVSHDIRSPLSALNMLMGQIQNVPEHQRLVIRNSVNRITDIANTLLQKSKEQKQGFSQKLTKSINEPMKLQLELLPALVDTLVSEKRVQYRDKIDIEIEADFKDSYGAFAKIDSSELKRVLSNLTNNAVEAFRDGKGTVTISVRKNFDSAVIVVNDNGRGIPQHIIAKLGEKGVSHGKEGTQSGSGLGVYHAKKMVECFGGKFTVESQEDLGTTMTLTFPMTIAPKWFVDKISLSSNTQVVSLDDDLSIHGIWKGRFHSQEFEEMKIDHLTFTSGSEFKEWFKAQGAQGIALKPNRLYLVDFELLNQNVSGLEIIEELGIGAQAILVTSRYEEPQIRAKCEKLGVRLIPKGMAPLVPIVIENKIRYDLCLLDDDKILVQTIWAMVAKTKSHNIKMFSTPEEFQSAADSIDRETPIFIDVSLGNGVNGVDFAVEVHKMGFLNINLATGYSADSIKAPSFIGRIIGKDYPEDI